MQSEETDCEPSVGPVAVWKSQHIPFAKMQAISAALQQIVRNDLIEPIDGSERVHSMVRVLRKEYEVINEQCAIN